MNLFHRKPKLATLGYSTADRERLAAATETPAVPTESESVMAATATLDKALPDLYAVGDTMTLTVTAPPEDRSVSVDVDVKIGNVDIDLHGGISFPIQITDSQGRDWALQDDDGTTAHYTSVASLPAA